ncbi:hypothetical protein VZT92_017674 [Zoarces viviparus]
MKTVILAILLLVVVSQGEALWCRCEGQGKECPLHVEKCKAGEVCGEVFIDDGSSQYYMGCMTKEECNAHVFTDISRARCCDWDWCTW